MREALLGHRAHVHPRLLEVHQVLLEREAQPSERVDEHDDVLSHDAHEQIDRPVTRDRGEVLQGRVGDNRYHVSLRIEPERQGRERAEDGKEDADQEEGERRRDREEELAAVLEHLAAVDPAEGGDGDDAHVEYDEEDGTNAAQRRGVVEGTLVLRTANVDAADDSEDDGDGANEVQDAEGPRAEGRVVLEGILTTGSVMLYSGT